MVKDKVRELVFSILKENSEARNSTRRLEYDVYCLTIPMFSLNVSFEDFCMSPCAETIQRTRRDIQNDPERPMFQATEKEQANREIETENQRRFQWSV